MAPTVRVMHDCQCFHLWLVAADGVENVSPDHLRLSAELAGRLNSWQSWGDSFLNLADIYDSRPVADSEFAAFEQEGRRLAERVAEERPDLTVQYHHEPPSE